MLENLRRWNAMLRKREGDTIHFYEPMTREKRPQDPAHDGSGLTFLTREHCEIPVSSAKAIGNKGGNGKGRRGGKGHNR